MRGLFTLTFEINGEDDDAIKASGLELKRLFNEAAAKRVPGFREGTFHCAMDGQRKPVPVAPPVEDPATLFDQPSS